MNPEDQLLEKSLATARDYADAVLLEPLKQFGGILSDTIGSWRLRNQVRILLGARKMLEESEVDPKKILPDVFIPLLEEGANVGDEELSAMFSSLLAEHLDSSNKNQIHPSYAKVLPQLSALDARALIRFWNRANDLEYRMAGLRGGVMSAEWLAEKMSLDLQVAILVCLNLLRLGLIERDGVEIPKNHPLPEFIEDCPDRQLYRITEYGVHFCEVCNRGKERDRFSS